MTSPAQSPRRAGAIRPDGADNAMIIPVPIPVLILAALVGVVIGSFLTVVIHRVPAGESIVRPRSRCPGCGNPIRTRDNIPVLSYLLRRGRCAFCREPISIRYPVIELATGALFVSAMAWCWHTGRLGLIPAMLYLVAIGVALTVIDVDVHRLPNAIVLPSYPVVAALLVTAAWIEGDWWSLGRAGIGSAALFGFYALLALAYPAGMGWGDVKLAGLLGAVLGYVSWSALVVGAFTAFLLGAIVAIVMLIRRRGNRRTSLPFGPFMMAGCAIGLVWGDSIASGYLGLIGV